MRPVLVGTGIETRSYGNGEQTVCSLKEEIIYSIFNSILIIKRYLKKAATDRSIASLEVHLNAKTGPHY